VVFDPDSLVAERLRLPKHVVHRTYESETIVLNLETGTYHGLNPTGGRMLEVVNEAPTVQAAAELIATEYEQDIGTVREDVASFCVDLLGRGLLEIVKE
jgi:hypothetical protein